MESGGASPIIRIGMLHTSVDPWWYQFWKSLMTFRRQCLATPTLRDWWSIFVGLDRNKTTFRPFSKLLRMLEEVGLTIDREFKLWFSAHGWIDFLASSEAFLERLVKWFVHQDYAAQVSSRRGLEDLSGFDYGLTTCTDSRRTPAECEQLMIIRDGSFFTDHAKSHYDSRVSSTCPWCNMPATRSHKYAECSRYDEVRTKHLPLFELWPTFPVSFREFGLVPSNPWQTLVWEALAALPDETRRFELHPAGNTWHIFTDGTCTSPTSADDSLAAWAAVWAGKGTISCGPLQGPQQCILRAELTAVLSAVKHSSAHANPTHMYTQSTFLSLLLRFARKSNSHVHTDEAKTHMYTQVISHAHANLTHMYTQMISHVHTNDLVLYHHYRMNHTPYIHGACVQT